MKPISLLCAAAAVALATASCSEPARQTLGPSAAAVADASAAADGSTLKVTAPALVTPTGGGRTENRRPAFAWSAVTGQYTSAVTPGYRLELLDANGALIDFRALPAGTTTFQTDADLAVDTVYRWRVRAELDGAFGPWSATGSFQTPAAPQAVSSLPFAIPASCGPQPNQPTNRSQCASDVARVSPEWGGCVGGSGVRCHRFVRHVAASLAAGDPRWGLITKNPGETQCTLDRCGFLSGEGYGEDVVAYLPGDDRARWTGFDLISGAGAPGAGLSWGGPLPRRAGNLWAPVP